MKPVIGFVGPPGVGKTSYAQRLIRDHGFEACPVYVTRANRKDDAAHVRSISVEEFRRISDQGGFLECDTYGGYWYGSSVQGFTDLLKQPYVRGIVLDLTPSGARQIRRSVPWANILILVPDSLEWLEARLRERCTDHETVICSRVAGLADYYQEIQELDGQRITCFQPPGSWNATFGEILTHIRRD